MIIYKSMTRYEVSYIIMGINQYSISGHPEITKQQVQTNGLVESVVKTWIKDKFNFACFLIKTYAHYFFPFLVSFIYVLLMFSQCASPIHRVHLKLSVAEQFTIKQRGLFSSLSTRFSSFHCPWLTVMEFETGLK